MRHTRKELMEIGMEYIARIQAQGASMEEVATKVMNDGHCATMTRLIVNPTTGEEEVVTEIVDISDIA